MIGNSDDQRILQSDWTRNIPISAQPRVYLGISFTSVTVNLD